MSEPTIKQILHTADGISDKPHNFDNARADESNEPLICASCGLDIKNDIHAERIYTQAELDAALAAFAQEVGRTVDQFVKWNPFTKSWQWTGEASQLLDQLQSKVKLSLAGTKQEGQR